MTEILITNRWAELGKTKATMVPHSSSEYYAHLLDPDKSITTAYTNQTIPDLLMDGWRVQTAIHNGFRCPTALPKGVPANSICYHLVR